MITVDKLEKAILRQQTKQYYDEEFVIDQEIVQTVTRFGYPKAFVIKSLEEIVPNHCSTGYYLLQAAVEAEELFAK
jgi:hypothetical protein